MRRLEERVTLHSTLLCALLALDYVSDLYVCCSPYTLHRLLLQLNRPEDAAKIRLPTGKKVRQRLDNWWRDIEDKVFFRDELLQPQQS